MTAGSPAGGPARPAPPEGAADGGVPPEAAAPGGDRLPEPAPGGDRLLPELAPRGDRLPELASRGDRLPELASRGDRLPEPASRGDRLPESASRGDWLPALASGGDRLPALAPGADRLPEPASDGGLLPVPQADAAAVAGPAARPVREGRAPVTVALVESPAQLLNLLEWQHAGPADEAAAGTVVVLPPRDPMTRGQLLRMAGLARDEGLAVRWCEPRTSTGGPLRTLTELAPALLRAERLVVGDPFSRLVQALLPLCRARDLVVIDDGTSTLEFVTLVTERRQLVRWHRAGRGRPKLGEVAFGPVGGYARRRLTPHAGRRVELFTCLPVTPPDGTVLRENRLAWTRARFGPPAVRDSADLIGTSLVENGVLDLDRYLDVVASIAKLGGATRYFAHRREREEKLRAVSARTGLEIVRPDLPLELIARRGPIGARLLSFPSTVVHTLPFALAGTGVQMSVCEIEPSWLTSHASPRAHGFLAGITHAARATHRPPAVRVLNPLPDPGIQAVSP